ncbi:hypothetical protein [Nostoc sphaeroides]|uniref:hypothetical protein n=1 Tax=Nostoc sphaeroides TaxID=446679 RepID=UPI002B4001DB|nr:hypothetical protein [Nostoc sphaeroides]
MFTEPLPPENPLWSLPNVFITPHCSGNSPRVKERSLTLFLDNFSRYRQGKPLRNIVDQTVEYIPSLEALNEATQAFALLLVPFGL